MAPSSTTDDRLSQYARWVLEPRLPDRPVRPHSAYFVCSVQRSGTWLLAGLLESAGIAGHPHEWFGEVTEKSNRARWGVTSSSDYLQHVLEAGTTKNGVFGSLLMWNEVAGRFDPLSGAFGRPQFIHLWREDVVAQAVSWSIASQTGYYHHWNRPTGEPHYVFEEIDGLARLAADSTEAWLRWFRAHDIEPLRIRFEDLVAEKEATARTVLRHLGLDAGSERIVPLTAEATNPWSEDWLDRYRREAAGGAL